MPVAFCFVMYVRAWPVFVGGGLGSSSSATGPGTIFWICEEAL